VSSEFVEIAWGSRRVCLEFAWVGEGDATSPLIVFLHEGLGSVAMWREFPERLCRAVGARGLVYSRPGYGRSTPRAQGEAWQPDFMHRQADEVLPALLAALRIDAGRTPIWLLGHSDGGSIALLAAARGTLPLASVVVLAPHILVEEISVQSIARVRVAYLEGDLRQRLAKYHDNADSAFWGWNDAWLNPAFRTWSIEAEIGAVACPLLAIQGLDDEYGTVEQVRGIARRVPHARVVEWPGCGHSPHRDRPEAVIAAVESCINAARALPSAAG
jgi:pimeloyl-ACP methyl ester carboxylesterase